MEVYEAMRNTFAARQYTQAVAAMIGIGKPVKQLTKLKRYPVETFTWIDTFSGDQFGG